MRYLVNHGTSVNILNDFDNILDSFFDNSKEIDFHHPAVDVWEDENKYILEAELPGLTEKDIDVKVDDKLLTVSSVKDEKSKEKKSGWLIRERKESTFSRSFVIPENADRDNINAEFKNGVLTLKIEKKAALKPKNIKIQVA
jgi:HSP20 family protein